LRLDTKRGDTEPIEAVLKDALGEAANLGTPPNLAAVRFLAKPAKLGVGQVVDRVCEVLQNVDGLGNVLNKGKVRIPWQAGDVALAGTHRAEFEVTFIDGTKKTFPTRGYVDWTVYSDLG
jgi:hypothetical protein